MYYVAHDGEDLLSRGRRRQMVLPYGGGVVVVRDDLCEDHGVHGGRDEDAQWAEDRLSYEASW